ncbi:hypothetical protein J2S00_001888 [Caldalkalibacillus uzonensis]|uniref:Uncharacterized protein n=1 Tax=Caldalkalibacillus uzonensis TaxID=353224 RepID=A0ABU0CSJ2_9BACI|nr:hypothetical protein [Caldalkalibacillus uzonensis]MDQ0339102.1 hypothetical protein [Caldalkalibacillus uzonensis]
MVQIWLGMNVLFVIAVLVWSWQKESISIIIDLAKLTSQTALILFLVNVNMYFIFLVIRKSKVRKIKVSLAKISRYMMKAHIPLAVTGTSLILIHAVLMLLYHTLSVIHIKMLSGMAALFVLAGVLSSGYLRHKKASGKRRKWHLVMAFIFMGVAIIHIFN